MNLRFIILLILISVTEARDPYRHRELKGGRSGGGRSGGGRSSSGRSSRSTTARSTYKVTNGVYKYSTVKNTPIRTNTYWDGSKTYEPLYVYYLPVNYYSAVAYYSVTYGLMYYDGYGYNFYYNTYGYYEYSDHPDEPAGGIPWWVWLFL